MRLAHPMINCLSIGYGVSSTGEPVCQFACTDPSTGIHYLYSTPIPDEGCPKWGTPSTIGPVSF